VEAEIWRDDGSVSVRQREQSAEERLKRLLELQALLAKVSREIGPALELEPVLQTVLSAMRSMVDFRGGTIQLVDPRGCYIAAADPPISAEVTATRVPLGTGLSGRAVLTAQTVYSPDLDDDPRVDLVQRRTGSNALMRSYLVVPLVVLGTSIGVVQVDSVEPNAFDAEDIAVLEGLATQVAGAIESARRYEEIIELDRLKGNFIARVSHELRTPLTIIGGFADTLLIHGEHLNENDQREALGRIKAASDRLSALLEEVLYVSSLDAGMALVRPQPVNLADLAAAVRELSTDPARVVVDVVSDHEVTADPAILRHILNQLVDNALKYGGDALISSSVEPDTGELVVSIRDHGPGVPSDQWELIFERFWRGEHAGGGMGLGLATVRQLCTSVGATVSVSEPQGGGAQLNVRFARPR